MVDDSVDFYLSLPFDKIYHDSGLSRFSESKKSIIFHRHAEVIVPEALDLSSLSYIICRSRAEFETLINLLSMLHKQEHLKLREKIFIDNRALFFFRQQSCLPKHLHRAAGDIILKPSYLLRVPCG